MRRWIWRHFGFDLPDDWEMLQFSRAVEAGRCGFADRYGLRLEFNWRTVGGPPDFDRMLSDYQAKLEQDQDVEDVQRVRMRPWHGFLGRINSVLTSRFGRFFGGSPV